MTTFSPTPNDIDRQWYVVDAEGLTLGRMATEIAKILRGKHKPTFAPHMDMGDHVIVVNADKIVLTSGKADKKMVYSHSGYPGGLRSLDARSVRAEDPERVILQAVKGMLPKNRLSRQVITKLKVYGGADHPHAAQKPQPFPP